MTNSNMTIWDRTPPIGRKRLIWGLWFVTWLGLVGGLYDGVYFTYVVFFSAAHAVLFLLLNSFQIRPFPVQVRIAYFIWIAVGTYVPGMIFLMYITLAGLATNLFLGYCPLARMMYLMPWNHDEGFSLSLLARVFLSPPMPGQFKPASEPG
jgi:hypothetical protein